MKIRGQILLWMLAAVVMSGLTACSALQAQTTPTVEAQPAEKTQPLVSATGKVVPAHWSRLSVAVMGIVQEVPIAEGDQVKKGDVLVKLKGKEDLNAAIAAARAEISVTQKALDDLNKNAETASNQTMDLIAVLEKKVRDAQYQLDNFTPPVMQSKMTTQEALLWAKQRLDKARADFEPYKYYSETDDTREDRKEDLDDAQADYNSAVKRLEYETELAVAQADLKKAKEDYAIWKAGPDPKDVAVAQARLDNAKAALAAADAQLEDLELRAPFDGTISEVDVRLGEWVTPEKPVMLIADLANLQVETTDLNEIDAARIAVGAPVQVTFDALPGVEVQGKVKSIAPKASEGSGVNYTAVILLDQIPELLRWGMTAFADIQTR